VLLAGLQLASTTGVDPEAWMLVEGRRVARVGHGAPPGSPDVELGGALVVPGFVDIHCHGGGGGSYGSGGAEVAARFHLRHGTTTTLASLVSETPGVLERQVGELSELVHDGLVEGVHLEGPYLAQARCGAHDPAVLRDPDLAEIQRLLEAADGAIRMVTLAPERDGAIEATAHLVAEGVLVAVGHTAAGYEETRAAVGAGARVATHVGNAMPPVHQRQPGALVALLEDERVVCEVIDDGAHLHPAVVRLVTKVAGDKRIALVTDAISAAGAGDGIYSLGPVKVRVAGGMARVEASGALAGSTLTMDLAFRRAVQQSGFSVPEAVGATSACPALLLGLTDRGHLRAGAIADAVVLDEHLGVQAVMRRGQWVLGP
jgi:N-acetylglucosamine-6-phosphate deacetylase